LTPDQRAAAELIARNAGITDPALLEDAIFDIALTNAAPEFIQGYVDLQRQATVNGANTLVNPDGFSAQHWLTAGAIIPYTIRFTNNATQSTNPIAQISITQQLDSDLDLNTFALNNLNFGTTTLTVPQGVQNFSQRLDLRNTRGIYVDINAGLDKTTGIVTWAFTAIDPATGNPVTDPTRGFLPPNDQNGAGQGTVGYSIQPKANSTTGARIDSQASILFDNQSVILTDAVFNTLDGTPPTSQVNALPATSNANITVTWTGSDPNGSGIAAYDIYVSVNGGQYTPWQTNTIATSATYTGQTSSTYSFYSIAKDNIGNIEALPPKTSPSPSTASTTNPQVQTTPSPPSSTPPIPSPPATSASATPKTFLPTTF
jgi:hypothetical protein